jgi:Na+-driven multidrug efflux pump
LTLVVEPLFLAADSAIIGHRGTSELAALGIASTVVFGLHDDCGGRSACRCW